MHHEPGFGGQSLGRRETAGVVLSETSYNRDARMGMHSHPHAYFCFVRRGSFRERWKRGSSEHHQDEIIFHPTGDEHANAFLDSSRCFNVELRPRYASGPAERTSLDRKAVRGILASLYREYREGATSPLVIEGLIYQLLGEAFERPAAGLKRTPAWLQHVRDEVDRRFLETLTVRQLSESVEMHPVHVARAYRKEYGATIGEHVRGLRVSYAQELLRNRSMSLSDIALEAGFSDQSHFSRLFKRGTGMTPRQYRG